MLELAVAGVRVTIWMTPPFGWCSWSRARHGGVMNSVRIPIRAGDAVLYSVYSTARLVFRLCSRLSLLGWLNGDHFRNQQRTSARQLHATLSILSFF